MELGVTLAAAMPLPMCSTRSWSSDEDSDDSDEE